MGGGSTVGYLRPGPRRFHRDRRDLGGTVEKHSTKTTGNILNSSILSLCRRGTNIHGTSTGPAAGTPKSATDELISGCCSVTVGRKNPTHNRPASQTLTGPHLSIVWTAGTCVHHHVHGSDQHLSIWTWLYDSVRSGLVCFCCIYFC